MIRWHKVRTIATFEFMAVAKRTGFLVATFGMPLFLALYAAIIALPAYYSAQRDRSSAIYGVVDQGRFLDLQGDVAPGRDLAKDESRLVPDGVTAPQVTAPVTAPSPILFRDVGDEAQARTLLTNRTIRGYFVLPGDYLETGVVDVYSSDNLNTSGSDSRNALGAVLRERLMRGRLAPDIAARVLTPLASTRRFAVTRTGDVKDAGQGASLIRFGLPLAFTMLFLVSVLMSAGYLLQGTATEKENKVVEVLLASANPDEIMAGKLAGLGAAGLIQVGVWTGMLFATGLGAAPLIVASDVELPWRALVIALPFFLVAFLFFGSLMLGSGSLGSNMREAQQLSMVWSLTAALPLMMLSVLIREPHGPIARVMTWLPLTAGPVVIMRASIEPDYLPWWEVAGPLLLLMVATWAAVRMGARVFRVGMLNAGARPSMREVWRQARLGN